MKNKKLNLVDWVTIIGILSSAALIIMFATGCATTLTKVEDPKECCHRLSLHNQEMGKFTRYCKLALYIKQSNLKDKKVMDIAEQGVRICVVSSEDSPAMAARIRKLGISDYYPGIQNKLELLQKKITSWNTALERICVIGDDLGDLELIKHVGFSFCPADAVSEVSVHVDYICRASGGTGAVREACDLICAAKMDRTNNIGDAAGILVGD